MPPQVHLIELAYRHAAKLNDGTILPTPEIRGLMLAVEQELNRALTQLHGQMKLAASRYDAE